MARVAAGIQNRTRRKFGQRFAHKALLGVKVAGGVVVIRGHVVGPGGTRAGRGLEPIQVAAQAVQQRIQNEPRLGRIRTVDLEIRDRIAQ